MWMVLRVLGSAAFEFAADKGVLNYTLRVLLAAEAALLLVVIPMWRDLRPERTLSRMMRADTTFARADLRRALKHRAKFERDGYL